MCYIREWPCASTGAAAWHLYRLFLHQAQMLSRENTVPMTRITSTSFASEIGVTMPPMIKHLPRTSSECWHSWERDDLLVWQCLSSLDKAVWQRKVLQWRPSRGKCLAQTIISIPKSNNRIDILNIGLRPMLQRHRLSPQWFRSIHVLADASTGLNRLLCCVRVFM